MIRKTLKSMNRPATLAELCSVALVVIALMVTTIASFFIIGQNQDDSNQKFANGLYQTCLARADSRDKTAGAFNFLLGPAGLGSLARSTAQAQQIEAFRIKLIGQQLPPLKCVKP